MPSIRGVRTPVGSLPLPQVDSLNTWYTNHPSSRFSSSKITSSLCAGTSCPSVSRYAL